MDEKLVTILFFEIQSSVFRFFLISEIITP